MLRRISRFRSDFEGGAALANLSVAMKGFPAMVVDPGAGWCACSPRGVSAVIRKWPVNGGPILEGLVSGST